MTKTNDDAGGEAVPVADAAPGESLPPWYLTAREDIGVKEWRGTRHNPKVVAYFTDAGHPEVQDDETAWCAAFTGAHLERNGIACSKSLAARSYLKWGRECEPYKGCIAVLSRGDPKGWEGHTGFLDSFDANWVWVLSGNQSDGVNVQRFPRARVLGFREPRPLLTTRTVRANVVQAVAAVGTGGTVLATELNGLGAHWRPAAAAGAVLSVIVALYAIYVRYHDRQVKGH